MATARDVIYRALSYDLDRQADAAIEDDELEDGISVLNDWMTSLESDDCYLGYTYINDASETVTVSPGVLLGITQNLAIQLAPMFGGKVSPMLEQNARKSLNSLMSAGVSAPALSFPRNLPRGAGQNSWRYTNRTFFDGKTIPLAEMSFSANTTDTVIATVETPVLVAGTWVEIKKQNFTTTAAGLITYTGSETQSFSVESRFTAAVAAKHVNFYLYLNGVVIQPSKSGEYVVTSSVIPLYYTIVLKKNDTLQFYIENIDDATDILVSDAYAEIK